MANPGVLNYVGSRPELVNRPRLAFTSGRLRPPGASPLPLLGSSGNLVRPYSANAGLAALAHNGSEGSAGSGFRSPGGRAPGYESSPKTQEEANVQAKEQVREMVVYAVFMALVSISVLFQRNDQTLFWFSNTLRDILIHEELPFAASSVPKTWPDLGNPGDLYDYLEGPFFTSLYTSNTFDGDSTLPVATPGSDTMLPTPGMVSGRSFIVGGIRLGQIRVQPSRNCPAPPEFILPTHWACFQDGELDMHPFGSPQIFTNVTFQDVSEPPFLSPVTGNFFGAPNAFLVLPPADPAARTSANPPVLQTIKALRTNRFIDMHTLAVTIDLAIHSPSLDYVCLIRLLAEMLPGGGMVVASKFNTIRLFRDYTPGDRIRVVIEALVMLLVLVYTVVEIRAAWKNGFITHFASGESLLHCLNLALFYVSCGYRIAGTFALPPRVNVSGSEFVPLRTAAYLLGVASDVNAFNAFLTWIKVFKYLSFIPKFRILLGTMSHAAAKAGVLFVICAIILFGAAQGFTLAFGTSVENFRNLTQSFYSLLRALLGDFNFEELRVSNPFLGPLLFFIFIVLGVFILINMFIAIISDAFLSTKAAVEAEDDIGVATVGKAITVILLDDGLYKIPGVGAIMRKCMRAARSTINSTVARAHVEQLFALLNEQVAGSMSADEVAAQLDADANGEVGRTELLQALLDVGATTLEATEIVGFIDHDENGVISTFELQKLIRLAQQNRSLQASEIEDGASTIVLNARQRELTLKAVNHIRINIMTQNIVSNAKLEPVSQLDLLAHYVQELRVSMTNVSAEHATLMQEIAAQTQKLDLLLERFKLHQSRSTASAASLTEPFLGSASSLLGTVTTST